MKELKPMMPFLGMIAVDFYLLPLLIQNTGIAMIMLLAVIPTLCFLCSAWYGSKNAFHLQFAVIVGLLFVPSIFIYYNFSAWIYILAYGIIAMAGNLLGTLFFKQAP